MRVDPLDAGLASGSLRGLRRRHADRDDHGQSGFERLETAGAQLLDGFGDLASGESPGSLGVQARAAVSAFRALHRRRHDAGELLLGFAAGGLVALHENQRHVPVADASGLARLANGKAMNRPSSLTTGFDAL